MFKYCLVLSFLLASCGPAITDSTAPSDEQLEEYRKIKLKRCLEMFESENSCKAFKKKEVALE